ncbi:MAG TPA: hypothetical protein VL633_01010 [Bacteroidota bacterium]|jgi:hypothetical protein|nr:hypothetical protein [Bacteroidota bacterium]
MSRSRKAIQDLIATADLLKQMRKVDVHPGDLLFVKTCNSVYTLRMIDHAECLASGGWFDEKGLSPWRVRITGCTWGGTSIKIDILAACGLCIEFANHVTTSEIRMIMLMPYWTSN